MTLTNHELSDRIITYLDDIDLNPRPHVNPTRCRSYVKTLCKGKPLSSLDHRTLRHLLNMFHGILTR